LVVGDAVLSVTGTIRSCVLKTIGFERRAALWHMIAARFPPAEDPPMAILEEEIFRTFWPIGDVAQRTASQESWTAAGKGSSGASLVGTVLLVIEYFKVEMAFEKTDRPVIYANYNAIGAFA